MKDTISNNISTENNKKNYTKNGKLSPFMFLIFVFVVSFVWIFPVGDMIHTFSDAKDDETSVVYNTEETECETEEETEFTTVFVDE